MIENKIFNAGKLIRHLNIPLKQSLDIRQFANEYLVVNHVSGSALTRRTFIRTLGEREASKTLSYDGPDPEIPCMPPVHMPYWSSFQLFQVPNTLYIVITPGTKAEYSPDEGLTTHSQVDPDSLSDREFKQSIQLEANRDIGLDHSRLRILISAFAKRDAAVKWVTEYHQRRPQCGVTLLDIDSKMQWTPGIRAYHAAYVMKELRIPLKQDVDISQFHHKYFILHRVPPNAILRTEDLYSF
jgi:hypothetical protein